MSFSRQDLDFYSHGTRCAVWLYRPESPGPLPCVVMGPWLAGIRGARLDTFAERFAEAGLAALVFDYRRFGDSDGQPRQVLSIRGQLEDWRAAVAAARGVEGIDPNRIALWGSSFSGGHAVRVAAEDAGVAAVVSQVPFVSGPAATAAVRPVPRQQLRMITAGLKDMVTALLHRPPLYLPLAGPPGSLAFLTSPDAEPGIRAITPPNWDERLAARFALVLPTYRPGHDAGRLSCPLFVALADNDVITPPGAAARLLSRAPRVELRRYPGGHFSVYLENFEQVVADQTEFLVRQLRA